MKIGITESGDASRDFSWVEKAEKTGTAEFNMMILITKNVTDEFIEQVLRFPTRIIVHATCTGYGGTTMEPGVPNWQHQLEQVRKLIAFGFPAQQVVVRIDPIFPTPKGLKKVEEIVEAIHTDVTRFRISVLDNYPHVQERFQALGYPVMYNGNFQASDAEFKAVDNTLAMLKRRFQNITFESCAEPKLRCASPIGCVNKFDMELLGLKMPRKTSKDQRPTCLCVANKVEMLSRARCLWCAAKQEAHRSDDACEAGKCKTCANAKAYGCENRCAYCYWK